MKQISDLAENKRSAEVNLEKQKHEKKEQTKRKIVPTLALIAANIIFISLDVRAFDVVAKMTGSILLASVTVIVSGVLALFWWDFLYPHSRKYSNKSQCNIAAVGTVGGILLSLVLAFLDYLVDVISINAALLWGIVIILTGAQAIMLAWWWMIDEGSKSEAKRQKSIASRLELQETTNDFQAEIESMAKLSQRLEEIRKQFPGPGQAAKTAKAMGYPILAQMLEDDDGDGIMNYQDPDWKVAPISKRLHYPPTYDTDDINKPGKEEVFVNPAIYKDPEPPEEPKPSF